MITKYIIPLLAVLFLVGCTTKKQIVSSGHDNSTVVRNEPKAETEVAEDEQTEQLDNKKKKHKEDLKEVKPEPVRWIFTDRETEHVRISNYNPIPTGENSITLSFSELSENFCYPYPGKVISNYGYRGRSMHSGVDIKAIPRDTIRAAFDGVVRMAKPYSGYGNVIVVRHYNGLETVYSHNHFNLVRPNDVVKSGQAIALAGRTGRATTEHLHFEIRINGNHVNPNLLLDTDNQCLKNSDLVISRRGDDLVVSNNKSKQVAGKAAVTSVPSVTTAAALVDNETKAETDQTDSKPQYYRVTKGDTLSKIAVKQKTTVAKLCSLNKITAKTILQINQRLRVR